MGAEHNVFFGQGIKLRRAKSTLSFTMSHEICRERVKVLVALLTLSPCPKIRLCSSLIGIILKN